MESSLDGGAAAVSVTPLNTGWQRAAMRYIWVMNVKFFLAALMLVACASLAAQGVSSATTREVGQLFKVLVQSNCEFSRNGSWYAAPKASEHLQRKFEYLQKKGLVTSTESFIELAATKSSMSGTPYQVRCGNAVPVSSQSWFTGKLRELRRRPSGSNTTSATTIHFRTAV